MTRHRVYAIGVDNYDNEVGLSYCANNAALFAETIGAVAEVVSNQVLDAPKSDPIARLKAADIRSTLDAISQLDLGPDDAVVFFFAGHGFEQGGRDYLAASDTDSRSRETAVSTDDVVAALRASRAGLSLLVIDACRDYSTRSSGRFGEITRTTAKRQGVVSIFGCGIGEVCRESADLGEAGQGILTYCLSQLIRSERRFVPVIADSELRRSVQSECLRLELPLQTPEVGVASLDIASIDLLSGDEVAFGPRPKRLVLLAGPAYAGKSTIGTRVAQSLGYTQVEMSSYAYNRYRTAREEEGYSDSIQRFMEDVVWKHHDFDVIAQDLLNSNRGVTELVVGGPRRPEEIDTLRSAGFEVETLYLYSDSRTRFDRHLQATAAQTVSPDFGVGLEEFVRRDLMESSWGLPKIGKMSDCGIVINDSVDRAANVVLDRIERRGWMPR